MADLTNINFSQGFQNHLGGNPIGSSSAKSSKGGSGFLSALGPIGAGIDMASGVAGALDSIFGWSAKRQHRMQKELMDKQQDQWKQQQEILNKAQLDQWTRENEYNDPTNYLKRLLDGADNNGLSKAAVLGELAGGSVGMSATGVSAPGSTSMPGAGGSTLLPFSSSNILSAMRQRAEISNIESQTEKNKVESGVLGAQKLVYERNAVYTATLNDKSLQETMTEKERTTAQRLSNILTQFDVDVAKPMTDARLRKLYAEVSSIELSNESHSINNRSLDERNQAVLSQSKTQSQLNVALALYYQVQSKLHGAQYVAQLQHNEHWNRTVSAIEAKIQNDASRSLFGNGIVSDIAGSTFNVGSSILSIVSDILGISESSFEKSPVGRIFASLFH